MAKGINVYETIRSASGTISEYKIQNLAASPKPCMFLSHKSEDKDPVKVIGEYIKEVGIDIYLDADDDDLQRAVRENDHKKITASIEMGIRCSTDLMVIVSENTKGSWWVPYEIGFGKNAKKHLSCLKLKDVQLPSFLSIVPCLMGARDLYGYLEKLKGPAGIGKLFIGTGGKGSENLLNSNLSLQDILMEASLAEKGKAMEQYLDE